MRLPQRAAGGRAGLAALALAGAALLGGAASLAGATPAAAVTDGADLVAACGDQPVCQFGGASISNAGDLAGALPDGVRVVVIPQPDQAESVQSSTLANQFKSATGADTVIIVEDYARDRFAVASDGDGAAIAEALYSQGEADGGIAIAAVGDQLTASGGGGDGGSGGIGGGAVVLGIAVAVAVIAAGAVALVVGMRRRARGSREIAASRKLEHEVETALNGPDGEAVAEAIERLHARAAAYPDISARLSGLAQHLSELFVRARKRGSDQQIRLLQAQYKDTLAKLHKALADDYYGDILANPQYWSGPETRLDEVRRAVDAVDVQAVENIRQVNESRDLDFKVALDSLIKTVSEAKLSDVYSDRAGDAAGDRAGDATGAVADPSQNPPGTRGP